MLLQRCHLLILANLPLKQTEAGLEHHTTKVVFSVKAQPRMFYMDLLGQQRKTYSTNVKGDTPEPLGWHISIHQYPTTTVLKNMPGSPMIFKGCRGHTWMAVVWPQSLQKSYENGGTLLCGFQRLQRPGKSILQNFFKNKGFMQPRATLGRLQEPVNIRRTLFEGKGHAVDPGITHMIGLYFF